jgi:hypothetical protein
VFSSIKYLDCGISNWLPQKNLLATAFEKKKKIEPSYLCYEWNVNPMYTLILFYFDQLIYFDCSWPRKLKHIYFNCSHAIVIFLVG